ncbi:MAG TPA: hypothetical protein VFS58_06075 [Steroidobacteraceae bacterium]|nr:hypothetical protein [Steroidobacteraceae bacterium]
MSTLASLILLSVAAAQNGADAAGACRAAHAADPPTHIACLEEALRRQDGSAPPGETKPTAGLGSEQLPKQRSAASRELVNVEIVSASYDADGRGLFLMADGQLWRETETTPRNQRLAQNQPYSARIERGKVRGYRMYVDGIRRMIKVERLK